MSIIKHIPCGLSVIVLTTFSSMQASAQGGSKVDFQLDAIVDVRGILTDDEVGIFDNGFGKVRFGGDPDGSGSRQRIRFGEVALVGRLGFGDGFTAVAHIQHNPDERAPLDIVEAYLRYKPVQLRAVQYGVRVGAFFPPVSFENEALAWGNKYTITNSAANTWIAEEVRPIGAEFTADYRGEVLRAGIQATIFWGNDRVGDALGFRGFTLNDSKIGLFGDLPVASVEGLRLNTENQPFVETDGRPGFALGANVRQPGLGELRIYAYDNRADSTQVGSEGRLWRARFVNISAKPELENNWTLIGQFQFGTTRVQPTDDDTRFFGTNFSTGSVLLAKQLGSVQLATRIEYFDQNDPSTIGSFPLGENGWASTNSVRFRAGKNHVITAEYLHVSSDRAGGPQNTPISLNENLFQLSYQFRF
ncbi:porin [Kordiimonas aquimaris]|uniref:porin n=1 Tax=Kordiimonas aquimaris TaxID=707591 RepID=UPI0021D3E0B5|nr:porin [Kordiimonas aquimaris]